MKYFLNFFTFILYHLISFIINSFLKLFFFKKHGYLHLNTSFNQLITILNKSIFMFLIIRTFN